MDEATRLREAAQLREKMAALEGQVRAAQTTRIPQWLVGALFMSLGMVVLVRRPRL